MHSIESYEIIVADEDGEVLLGCKATELDYEDGATMRAYGEDESLVVEASTRFKFDKVPQKVMEYFAKTGVIRVVEFSDEGIDRLCNLTLDPEHQKAA